MKTFILLLIFILSLPVFAAEAEMEHFVKITDGQVYAGHVPRGYRSVKVNSIAHAAGLKSFLTRKTKEKMKVWKEYVFSSEDYEGVSAAEKKKIAANPAKAMDVKAILEIAEVYAIYKGKKLIGYFVEITDHVQGAIYQDGAWYDVFFDSQIELVEAFERSA